MSATLQTIVAFALVALAATYLAWNFLRRKKQPGCGSEGCGAVSPELKKIQAKLKR